ncbi:MAG: hypothetical protein QG608_1736 [Actinomycetota bacterium]|nr:hypothetical protein [Actinomycetota bacterium]
MVTYRRAGGGPEEKEVLSPSGVLRPGVLHPGPRRTDSATRVGVARPGAQPPGPELRSGHLPQAPSGQPAEISSEVSLPVRTRCSAAARTRSGSIPRARAISSRVRVPVFSRRACNTVLNGPALVTALPAAPAPFSDPAAPSARATAGAEPPWRRRRRRENILGRLRGASAEVMRTACPPGRPGRPRSRPGRVAGPPPPRSSAIRSPVSGPPGSPHTACRRAERS